MAQLKSSTILDIDAALMNLALVARRLRKPDCYLTGEGARWLEEQIGDVRLAVLELMADKDAALKAAHDGLRKALERMDQIEGRSTPATSSRQGDRFPEAPAQAASDSQNVVPFRRRTPFGRRSPGGAA